MSQKNLSTRERLLQTAILEFAEKGPDDANLREICARADVNLNAVRYHFGGKDALYIAAVEVAHRTVVGEMHNEESQEPGGVASPEERLKKIIAGMLAMSMSDVKNSTPEEKLMFREMVSPTEATSKIARSHVKPRIDFLKSVIAELLPDDTPEVETYMMVTSVIGQCMHFKFGRQMDRLVIPKTEYRKFTIPRLTEHILRVTLAAIHDRTVGSKQIEADEDVSRV